MTNGNDTDAETIDTGALTPPTPAILAHPVPSAEELGTAGVGAGGGAADTGIAVAEAAPAMTRDAMRAKIFSAKPKTETVEDFYGATLELRQPSLAVALEARNQEENEHVFTMLLDYAFVPGTDEKVFESTDVEMIRALPFGPSMTDLLAKVNKLLGIDGAAIEEMLKDATKSAEG